ncbi:MAG: MBL fold metallo-hydrolase [Anaerolineae bacterium]
MFRDLVLIAPSVYIFPRDETPNTIQPNIGVIRHGDQTILIDSGNSPRHARQIIGAINSHLLPPISTIILTHHHWDHSFGAASFNPDVIIAHERCAHHLAEYAQQDWNASALREAITENPRLELSNNAMIDAISDWREFRIVQPDLTFANQLSLHLDGMVIELEHVGGRHADDSVVVRLPEQGVMFLGDSYYPEPYHLRAEGDEDLELDMLDHFLADNYAVYVDGHGAPRNYEEFAKMIAWERGRQGVNE